MSTNNEIEFKQLIDFNTYNAIKASYFKQLTPFTQINYYIETPSFKLRDHRSALRIRVKQNTFEITLKVPAKVGLIEYNHPIDIKPHIGQTIVKSTLPNDIQKILTEFDIEENELSVLGALTTERLEVEFQNELLVLDKSQYFDKTDYELEFEVNDYQIGFEKFQNLLKQFDLVHEPPKNKVQRFFEYQAQLG